MSCGKIKQRCGEKVYSTCVYYEMDLPDFTKIEDDCEVTIEETTQDLYDILEEIKDNNDLSDIGEDCLQYEEEDGELKVKNILKKYEEKICELEGKVEELEGAVNICEQSLEGCNIDFGCLEDECGEQINTVGQALQVFADKLSEDC